jgi:hypothetical protein
MKIYERMSQILQNAASHINVIYTLNWLLFQHLRYWKSVFFTLFTHYHKNINISENTIENTSNLNFYQPLRVYAFCFLTYLSVLMQLHAVFYLCMLLLFIWTRNLVLQDSGYFYTCITHRYCIDCLLLKKYY